MAPERNSRLVYSTGGPVPNDPEPRQEPKPSVRSRGVRLSLERRASGRVVTVIHGLTGSQHEIAALAQALKAACGAGGSAKDGVVELQGDHRDAVEQHLAGRGVRSRRAGG